MKPTRIFIIMIISLLILMSTYEATYGTEIEDGNKTAYVIVVNKLTLIDIEEMPNLKKLIKESGFGLMNVRGVSDYTGAASFATINASNRTYASNKSSQFYNLDFKYKNIYENRVGKIKGEYSVGNIEISRLYNENIDNDYNPYIGLLGNCLHEYGLKTAIFGNSDTQDYMYRYASLIPMDSKGLIDYGNVDNVLKIAEDYPYGKKTNYEYILKSINDLKNKASLIVIDLGDLFRLYSSVNFISDEIFYTQRNKILKDIDFFIYKLINIIDRDKSLLFILSPNSGDEELQGSKLSPIVLWGNNINEGILSSSTTKYSGIVSNLDIGPTIANFFEIKMNNASGSRIILENKQEVFNYIKSINDRINLTSKVRSKTLSIYGTLSIIVLVITIVSLILQNIKIKVCFDINKLSRILLLIIYGIPMIFIISSLFNIDSIYKFIFSIMILLVFYILVIIKYNRLITLYIINFLYFVIIMLDIIFKNIITRYSVLSYDPIIGARYYGIGNELVGLFLTVSMITISLIYYKFKSKTILTIMLILSIAIVGNPQLGANVGGMITFLSAAFYFIIEVINKKLSVKKLIIASLSMLAIIGVLGLLDVKINPNPSHFGKMLIKIKEEGVNIFSSIIFRKLKMNIKLIGNSFWTKVLFTNIIIQLIVSFNKDKVNKINSLGIGKGYISCIFGSIVGFLLNDSGLILTAIAINVSTIVLMFILTESLYETN